MTFTGGIPYNSGMFRRWWILCLLFSLPLQAFAGVTGKLCPEVNIQIHRTVGFKSHQQFDEVNRHSHRLSGSVSVHLVAHSVGACCSAVAIMPECRASNHNTTGQIFVSEPVRKLLSISLIFPLRPPISPLIV